MDQVAPVLTPPVLTTSLRPDEASTCRGAQVDVQCHPLCWHVAILMLLFILEGWISSVIHTMASDDFFPWVDSLFGGVKLWAGKCWEPKKPGMPVGIHTATTGKHVFCSFLTLICRLLNYMVSSCNDMEFPSTQFLLKFTWTILHRRCSHAWLYMQWCVCVFSVYCVDIL